MITTLKKNEPKIREFACTLESISMSGSRKVMRLARSVISLYFPVPCPVGIKPNLLTCMD